MKLGSAVVMTVMIVVLGACATNADVDADPTTSPPSTTSPAPSTTTTTTTLETRGCAAAGLPPAPVEQDLPGNVAELRNAIVAAAVSCDVAALAQLAGSDFTYSFGGGDDPAAYWEDLEARSASSGEPSPLSILVRLLDLPFATIESSDMTYFVWPSAHAYGTWDEVPPADRDALLGVYGAQDLIDFEAFGGYVGYRVGITADGDWSYFVAGD